jgi:molybdenum transport protein
MIFFTDEEIDRLISEDIPYGDLTTWVLGIGQEPGVMQVFSREEAMLCGTEEAERILRKLGLEVLHSLPSGTIITPGQVCLEAKGTAQGLHMAWKVTQNLLECCSGIASKTKRIVDKVQGEEPGVSVVGSRKSFPGTKKLAAKAILCGGAYPHRLGLSETLLVFPQHMEFAGGLQGFIPQIPRIKAGAPEKKLLVEAESLEEGLALCRGGVDAIQFDKLPPAELKRAVTAIREVRPDMLLLAAGGIDEHNAGEYAGTGVNALVTTSLYFARSLDMSVRIARE